MTVCVIGGVPNPLSVITTASMGDLGYVVNYAASEPYTVANVAGLRAPTAPHQIELGEHILRLPLLVVDKRRRMTRVIRPKEPARHLCSLSRADQPLGRQLAFNHRGL